MLEGLLCGSAYLVFAVAVTTAAASAVRSTFGTIGVTVGALLALPLVAMIGPLHRWLPSTLVTAPVSLLGRSSLGDYVPALATTAIITALLLIAATLRLQHRDL